MASQTQTPNVESRLLAALAHGSVVAQGLGLLVGVVVYTNQRDRSRYAAFQALQAAIYQLISLIIVVGIWIAWNDSDKDPFNFTISGSAHHEVLLFPVYREWSGQPQ